MALKRSFQRAFAALLMAASIRDASAQEPESPQELFKRYGCARCLAGCVWSPDTHSRLTYAIANGAQVVDHKAHGFLPNEPNSAIFVWFDLFIKFSELSFIRNDFNLAPDQTFNMTYEPHKSFSTDSRESWEEEWKNAFQSDRKYLIVSLNYRDGSTEGKPVLTRVCELPG